MKKFITGSAAAMLLMSGAAFADGKATYDSVCSACHNPAVAPTMKSPGLGDKAAWAPRIAKGMDALLASSTSGLNAMPPKGLCMTCSDAELMAAIEYMVSNSR